MTIKLKSASQIENEVAELMSTATHEEIVFELVREKGRSESRLERSILLQRYLSDKGLTSDFVKHAEEYSEGLRD